MPLGAGIALPARHEEAPGHVLPDGQAGVLIAGAHLDDGAGDLVTEDGGQGEGDGAADDVEIGVAQAAGGDLDEDLAGLGPGGAQGLDLEALGGVAQDGRAHGIGDVRVLDCVVAGHDRKPLSVVAGPPRDGRPRWHALPAYLICPDIYRGTNGPSPGIPEPHHPPLTLRGSRRRTTTSTTASKPSSA
ncbi:cell envelope-related transcriptional attenuator [Actinomyces denticolens]|nr:cell envelope-related transcriptional attenuator [Actinomyces denticolens]